jgi:acetyl esterase/lipase
MHDGARAVQYLRSRAKEWNLDPARVAATGGSAGAGISLWLAFHADLADPKSKDPVARQSDAADLRGRARGPVVLRPAVHQGSRDAALAAGEAGWRGGVLHRATCASLLREIVGNPFRAVPLNPAWLAWGDGTVARLAQAIYDERGFEAMPALADALEEAGYDAPDLVGHCRQPGSHYRGCWVVDALRGQA